MGPEVFMCQTPVDNPTQAEFVEVICLASLE